MVDHLPYIEFFILKDSTNQFYVEYFYDKISIKNNIMPNFYVKVSKMFDGLHSHSRSRSQSLKSKKAFNHMLFKLSFVISFFLFEHFENIFAFKVFFLFNFKKTITFIYNLISLYTYFIFPTFSSLVSAS